MRQKLRILSLLVALFAMCVLIGGKWLPSVAATDKYPETATAKFHHGVYTDTVYLPYNTAGAYGGGNLVANGFSYSCNSEGTSLGFNVDFRDYDDFTNVMMCWVYGPFIGPLIAEPGPNTVTFSCMDLADNSAPDTMDDGTINISATTNLIQLTNTTTIIPPSKTPITHSTTDTEIGVTLPVGTDISLQVAPNMGGPNEKYEWSGYPVGATVSGGSCSFKPMTPGGYIVQCVYSWDVYESGFWDWEETIPYNKNADGTDRAVQRASITVTFYVNVIQLTVVIDAIIGPNDPDFLYLLQSPVTGSFTRQENGITCISHIAQTEWAAEYEPYIQWGYLTESGLLSGGGWRGVMNTTTFLIDPFSGNTGAETTNSVSEFLDATDGRTCPLSVAFQAWIPLTDTLYVANRTDFVTITQDTKDQKRQSYWDVGAGKSAANVPSRPYLISQDEYAAEINCSEEFMAPWLAFCLGAHGNRECNGDTSNKKVCRAVSHGHGVYAPLAVVGSWHMLNAVNLQWSPDLTKRIRTTCCYRCPIHNKHITTSKDGVNGDHAQGFAFDYNVDDSDENWEIAHLADQSTYHHTFVYYMDGDEKKGVPIQDAGKKDHTWVQGHIGR